MRRTKIGQKRTCKPFVRDCRSNGSRPEFMFVKITSCSQSWQECQHLYRTKGGGRAPPMLIPRYPGSRQVLTKW